MASTGLWLCLLLSYVSNYAVSGDPIQCPDCADPYNRQTCNRTQNCDMGENTVCQMTIHTKDQFKLEYTCQTYQVCGTLELQGCQPRLDDTCTYCCSDPFTCDLQRDDLFDYELPSLLSTTAAQTTKHTTVHVVATHTHHTTRTPASTTPKHHSTPRPATTISPPSNDTWCVQCGNLALHQPCTATELMLDRALSCPTDLPYCFSVFSQNGTDLAVYKGCATANFCSLENELTNSKSECQKLDIAVSRHVTCGYCCDEDACNASLGPDDDSQVVFP